MLVLRGVIVRTLVHTTNGSHNVLRFPSHAQTLCTAGFVHAHAIAFAVKARDREREASIVEAKMFYYLHFLFAGNNSDTDYALQ